MDALIPIIVTIAWLICGAGAFLVYIDDHRCLWCLAVSFIVCMTLGPILVAMIIAIFTVRAVYEWARAVFTKKGQMV